MTGLLYRVKSKLAIRAHRRVRGLLDGEYTSIFRGKSHEFDDLRSYVPGDEIRDIDWKATARYGAPLTKQYIANRKHHVMIVVDTGRNMAALSASGAPKRDVAILAAGVMGYLAHRHGDYVGAITGDEHGIHGMPPRGLESYLERILVRIQSSATLEAGKSDFNGLLEFIARTIRRRMILVVIGDDESIDGARTGLLRRLHGQHEILWITVGDADIMRASWAGAGMFDVTDEGQLPQFVRRDRKLRAEFEQSVTALAERTTDQLENLGISSVRVTGDGDVIPQIFRLLEMHNHARR